MKARWTFAVIAIIALWVSPALAQYGQVRGFCKDAEGKPIVGAIVEWRNVDSGQTYKIKTNGKGEYFSLGITAGNYKVRLLQGDKELFNYTNIHVGMEEKVQDFDLQQEQKDQAAGKGLTPEQLKQMQEAQAKHEKEVTTVKSLNEKLRAANDASVAGNYDVAIAQLTEATAIDPNRYLLWAKLGEAQLNSAGKQTDSAEKTKRYNEAINDYQKAIDMKQKEVDAAPQKGTAVQELAAYYNNLANAYARVNKAEDAMKAYEHAATLNPAGAAQYYYNEGAILTNSGKADEAIQAFDKAIAADPNRADAYYQKGVNLVAKATTDKSGKIIPAPGTLEALNKYLELQPNGPYADGAKGMIQYLGGSIETSYGKKKK